MMRGAGGNRRFGGKSLCTHIDIEFTSLSCVDFHVTAGLMYDSIIFDVFPLRLDRPTL